MQTLESLLKKGTTILKDNGLEEAGLDAWLLLEYKTGKNRAYYFAHGDEPVSDETAAEYLELIGRRAGHIPVQQLTHQAFFMNYEFYVNENVLIPRQDTETLVEEGLKCLDHGCSRSDQCIVHLVIQLHVITHIPVHDSIRLNNDKWKHFFSKKNPNDAASYCCKECIAEIFGCNGHFSVTQCFHGSDLGTLFFHHSCHGGKADKSRYQEEDHRENFSDIFQALCIIPEI